MSKRFMLIIPLLLAAACGMPVSDEAAGESSEALAVKAGPRSLQTITAADLATAKGKMLRLDLSGAETAVLFDGRKGAIDLERVEVVLESGAVVPALKLLETAGQSVDPKVTGRFVLSAPSKLISGGGGGGTKCPIGQTDCCECDYWDRAGGINICLGFWCPCGDSGCGPILHF